MFSLLSILLDGPPAIFIVGGFIVLIVLPLLALIGLIWFFVRRNRRKKKEVQGLKEKDSL